MKERKVTNSLTVFPSELGFDYHIDDNDSSFYFVFRSEMLDKDQIIFIAKFLDELISMNASDIRERGIDGEEFFGDERYFDWNRLISETDGKNGLHNFLRIDDEIVVEPIKDIFMSIESENYQARRVKDNIKKDKLRIL